MRSAISCMVSSLLLPFWAAAETTISVPNGADPGRTIFAEEVGACFPEHAYQQAVQTGDFNTDDMPDFVVRPSARYTCPDGNYVGGLCGSAGCGTKVWVSSGSGIWSESYDRHTRAIEVVEGATADLLMIDSHPFGARCEEAGVYPCPVYLRFQEDGFVQTEPELPKSLNTRLISQAEARHGEHISAICPIEQAFQAIALPHHRWAVKISTGCDDDGWNWGETTTGAKGMLFSLEADVWQPFSLGKVEDIWFEPGDQHPDITSQCPAPEGRGDSSCIAVARRHIHCEGNTRCIRYYRYNYRPWRAVGTSPEN